MKKTNHTERIRNAVRIDEGTDGENGRPARFVSAEIRASVRPAAKAKNTVEAIPVAYWIIIPRFFPNVKPFLRKFLLIL